MCTLLVLDSWGKIPSAFFDGNMNELGGFSECLNVKRNDEVYESKYCLGEISLEQQKKLFQRSHQFNTVDGIFPNIWKSHDNDDEQMIKPRAMTPPWIYFYSNFTKRSVCNVQSNLENRFNVGPAYHHSNSQCVCRAFAQWNFYKYSRVSQNGLNFPKKIVKIEIRAVNFGRSTIFQCNVDQFILKQKLKFWQKYVLSHFFSSNSSELLVVFLVLVVLSTSYDLYYTIYNCMYENYTHFFFYIWVFDHLKLSIFFWTF